MALVKTLDSANVLTDLDTAKNYLQLEMAETKDNNTVIQFINSASWFCNSYTYRKLKSRSLTEYYSGDGENVIFTNNYPITAITNVYDDPDRSYGADTLIDSGDLVYMPNDLAYKIVYDGGTFTRGIKNLKVEYTAGYETVPYDLEEACLQVVGMFWNNIDKGWLGVIAQTLADGNINIESTFIPKSALTILDVYRRKW